jgi:hypothetical protein
MVCPPEYQLLESAMKNTALRILLGASLLAFISGSVVVIIGLTRGWKTSIQFSDGFFWAGAIMIFIGLISYQGYSQRNREESMVSLDPADRSNLWAADTLRGKNLMAVFGTSSLLLFSLSFLVGRLL